MSPMDRSDGEVTVPGKPYGAHVFGQTQGPYSVSCWGGPHYYSVDNINDRAEAGRLRAAHRAEYDEDDPCYAHVNEKKLETYCIFHAWRDGPFRSLDLAHEAAKAHQDARTRELHP
jgi:hypothetical protein